MRLLRHVWVLPLAVLVGVYANEAASVFIGATEHFEILSGLGLGDGITTALVWLAVIIEAAIIGAVLWRPSPLTFSIAALWPWVPRMLTAFTGGNMEMMEMNMSLIATVAAMCAYMAYEHGFYPEFLRRHSAAAAA